MKEKVHIHPCSVGWHNMAPGKNSRFCNSCEITVVDFSNKTLEEIKTYLSQYGEKKICGHYQERHTAVSGKWYDFLNYLESLLSQLKLQRFAVFLITMLLLLSACYKNVEGRMSAYPQKDTKRKNKAKQDTARIDHTER